MLSSTPFTSLWSCSRNSGGANSRPGSTILRILFYREPGMAVEIVDDPALALGHDLVAKFLRRQFIAPLAEGAFRELLDIALVH